ncbi:MAG TPA: translocation/assembly module TamB domain-containing protein [Planctomycetota bacterium]|nr:translocation/assembly module TamB domain-containing protein [Planctomycetota bacterium]
MERKRRWRPLERLLRVLAFLVLATLALAVGAYVLRGPLFGRMLADRLEEELGKALGGRFSIVRIEGSYLFDLAVVGLRTEEAPPGPLRRLECGRAVLRYDLRRLIDGDLSAVSFVLASNLVVEVDATRSGGAAGAGMPELPRYLPTLEIQGEVAVRTAIGEFRATGLLLNTTGTQEYGVRAAELRLPERFGPAAPFAGTVTRTGPRAFVLAGLTPVAGVTPERVAYDGAVDARLVVGGGPLDVALAAGEARLHADALDLARLPAWVYPEGVDRPGEAVVSVDARATSLDPPVVDVTASAPRVRWRDADVRDVRVEGRYDDGAITVRLAHAEGRGIRLDAKDVAVDPSLPWLVGDIGEAVVRIDDLRALEPRLDRALSVAVTARRAGSRGVRIEAARVEGEGIRLDGSGEVVPPDDPARWQEAAISAKFAGSVRDFASGAYGFGGEVRLAGEVKGTLVSPDAFVRIEGTGLRVEGRTVDRAAVTVRIAPPLLRVQELRVEGESGTLRAEGAVDLGKRTLSGAAYEIDVTDLRGFLALFPGAPELEGSVSGRGRLEGNGTDLAGSAEIVAAGLVSGETEIGSVTASVRASDGEIRIDAAEAKGAWGTAKASGAVHPDEGWAILDALEVEAGAFEAKLNRPARIGWDAKGTHAAPLDIAALGGRIAGTAEIPAGGGLRASLVGDEIDLSLLDPRLAGRASAELRVDGERYEVEALAPTATYEGHAANLRLRARSDLAGIVVEKVALDAGEALKVEGSATLPWRFDGSGLVRVETTRPVLSLEARARRFAAGDLSVGEAVASIKGEGTDLHATVRLRGTAFSGFEARGEALVDVDATPGRLEASAVLQGSDLADAEARVRGGRGFDWTRPEEVRTALEETELGGEILLRLPDLAALRHLVPGLAELSGTADGTLALKGTLAAPSLEGSIHLAGIDARVEGDVPRLMDGAGEMTFDGRVLRIERFEGQLGYAPVGVSGSVDLGGRAPSLDLVITGRNTLVVAMPDLRVRADLDVSVKGPVDALHIGGGIVVADALYTRPRRLLGGGSRPSASSDAGPLFRIRNAPLASATFDLGITADETIRVRTSNVSGNVSCDLKLRGTGEAPAPEGRVFVRDLLFEERPITAIKVDRGEIRFPPGEPFDPRIDLAAHTRIKGYDIDVTLDGPAADAELRIATRPYLSQDDAILLLGTGYTREELESEGIARAAFGKLATFLGAHLVSSFSGPRDPDERSFLERFKFTVGKEVSRSGEDTIEGEFEASDKLFLRVERDRFDDYNGGIVWRIRFR